MARRGSRASTPPPPEGFEERIVDVDVGDEMRASYLEYSYSVIYARAIPDARDGLKPVQRRILYTMAQMGLRPDRGFVKCGRVVGEVMGKLHPHGDGAIYDTLVRLAQPWSQRVPLVDGHGNFGSPDDGPAAYRYTECRMAPPALALTASLDEDVVDFRPNYDGQETEPAVLPAALPNLLVNGASGIAVGMATNLPPHNLVEVVAALRHLLAHPDASLDDLMRFVPGPDLPTGGKIVGLAGVREAYETGRGSFRMQATTRIEAVTPRRKGIVVTELPYGVGTERVAARIKDLVGAKRLAGIADIKDLTDRQHGLRFVVEVKNGFHPEAVLAELFRLTPMEEGFSINAVALVDGQPRTLGLTQQLQVYLDHRIEVTRRRTAFRLGKARDELHLLEGLLVAVLNIDEVIQVIRTSDDAEQARTRLIEVFDLSVAQADHILAMRLRRLTRFSRIELEQRQTELQATIGDLQGILDDEARLRRLVGNDLAEVARAYGTPRRTVLLESAGSAAAAVPLEVGDDPCRVLLSSTGLLARTAGVEPFGEGGSRGRHDVVRSAVRATVRGHVGLVTSAGRLLRLSVLDLPALPPTAGPPHLRGGAPVGEFVALAAGERALALTTLASDPGDPAASPGLALGTAGGVVKRVLADHPAGRDSWELIALHDGDEVVGAVELASGSEDLVFVSSDAQLLRFPAGAVRPQGRGAAGMAGIRLSPGVRAVYFGAVADAAAAVVVTVAGSSAALPGTQAGTVKVTPYALYPGKGRATGGVRCHRFLRGEDTLLLGWAGAGPVRAAAASGAPVDLPPADSRRDGSGVPAGQPIAAVAGPAG